MFYFIATYNIIPSLKLFGMVFFSLSNSRCVGTPPDTVVRCMKAGEEAFKGTEGDFDIEGSTDCHYNKVNPYFGAQLYAAP